MKEIFRRVTNNFEETKNFGQWFAAEILRRGASAGAVVLALSGELGAGKTAFLQGFARGLGIVEVVNSPTFIIMKKFPMVSPVFKYFYHLDLYRLHQSTELRDLGFEEIVANPANIVAVEWPERAESLIPKNAIIITFNHQGGDRRDISIAG